MIIAVLSDIHSNIHALRACLAKAEQLGAQQYVFLGDYISDCSSPTLCLDELYALARRAPCTFIRGNRDDAQVLCRKDGCPWTWSSQSGSLRYTYEALRQSDLDWLESLPGPMTLEVEGCAPLLLCHGSPERQRELLYPDGEATRRWAERIKEGTMLCGHSHKPFVRTFARAQIVNSGTVGMPCNGDPRAEFALLRSGGELGWQAENVAVEYDVEAEVRAIVECGLLEKAPWWARGVIWNIRTGRSFAMACLLLAQKRAAAAGEVLSESHWREAGRILKIDGDVFPSE